MRAIKFIALKELYHVFRDPRSLTIVLVMPIMMTFLYGYAINMDIENVTLAAVDYDRSELSRRLIDDFYNSTYFTAPEEQVDARNPESAFRAGRAHAVLTIAPGFESAIINRESYSLSVVVDGSDNNVAAAVQNYTEAVFARFLTSELPIDAAGGISLSARVLYNPDLESSHFFVPGLVAVILLMVSALLTSITIARETETGTINQLLVAPVSPLQVLIGKLMPYIGIAFIDGMIVLVFARLVFGVPMIGSSWLLLGTGLVYVATGLSFGVLISTVVRTQQVAMMLALLSTVLPSVMLSGFIFAIKNMPIALQWISNIVPAKFFMIIIRGVMLKGAGWNEVFMQGIYLILYLLIVMTISTFRFRTQMDR
jgi:ABC-2 type transport system permease protein